jgi:pimeloyl-ACP methyl ester carboxylesterase
MSKTHRSALAILLLRRRHAAVPGCHVLTSISGERTMRGATVRTDKRHRVRMRARIGGARMLPIATMTLGAALLLSPSLRAQAPAAGAAVENVRIAVPGGGPALTGRYRSAGHGSPGVLLFPMCSPTGAEGWRPVAERLRAAGVSSLMVAEPGWDARAARADAALAFLRSRLGASAPIALTGGSCGVALALSTAFRHPERVRAIAVLSGPYENDALEHVRTSPRLAVFSGASAGEPPSPEWARALKQASAHPASRIEIWTQRSHGTDYFAVNPSFADRIADWLIERLKGP